LGTECCGCNSNGTTIACQDIKKCVKKKNREGCVYCKMTQQLVNRIGELFKHTNWFDPAQSDLHRRHCLTPGLYFLEKI
jgi:hypothetical protein